jgi:HK97 family phage prohead protease
VIAGPEAFAGSLRSHPVRALVDHAPEKLIGRTESGTLQVTADSIGLRFAVDLPKGVSYADDLAILLQRGDAFENSFAFSVDGADGESWSEQPDGTFLRTLKRCILYEGSILTGNNSARRSYCSAPYNATSWRYPDRRTSRSVRTPWQISFSSLRVKSCSNS